MPRKKSTKPAEPVEATAEQAAEPTTAEPTKAKAKKAKAKSTPSRKAKSTGDAKTKKLSALDAAAKVLAEASEPLNTQQMIEAMSTQGYWTSPGGKTPAATLYSALIREIKVKGRDSRFQKTDRGLFARNAS